MKKYFLLTLIASCALLVSCGENNSTNNTNPNGGNTNPDSSENNGDNGNANPDGPGEGGEGEGGGSESIDYSKSIGIDKSKPHNAYQLLIYSFSDSDGDGFGDLKGVENKLDYIKDLGFDVIWLSPIMPCENYHGYDVTSFYGIDSKIGTLEDYKSLVVAAHKKDIKLVLDMPINHTSINHEWFKGFAEGDPKYAHYYQEKDPSINYGNTSAMGDKAKFYQNSYSNNKTYFAAFGEKMPDLNYQSIELENAIRDVFTYWIDLGTDGFRFDAIKHIYDPNEIPANADSLSLNNAFFTDLSSFLKEKNPNIYTVGENFSGNDEVKKYAHSFDSEFDFETWHKALGAVTNKDPWGQDNCRQTYDDTVVGVTKSLVETNSEWLAAGMSGNHDVTRTASYIAKELGDKPFSEKLQAFKLYASMLMLRRGMPYVYYGDEIGMYGENKGTTSKPLDAEVRLPMTFSDSTIDLTKVFTFVLDDKSILSENVLADWPTWKADNPNVEEQIADANSLYNTYKKLIAFRNSHPAIYKGDMDLLLDQAESTIYKTTYGDETLYVALNFGETATTYKALSDNMTIEFAENGAIIDGSNLVLPGRSVAVFKTTEALDFGFAIPSDIPSEGFALLIKGVDGTVRWVALESTSENDGFKQYKAENVSLVQGEAFALCDCAKKTYWVEDTLDPYGDDENFDVQPKGVVCNVTANYNFYLKLKFGQDQIYIKAC